MRREALVLPLFCLATVLLMMLACGRSATPKPVSYPAATPTETATRAPSATPAMTKTPTPTGAPEPAAGQAEEVSGDRSPPSSQSGSEVVDGDTESPADSVSGADTATEPQVASGGALAFDAAWHGPEVCPEREAHPYRWGVGLMQDTDGAIYGSIRFHDCPGGGVVVYLVSGEGPTAAAEGTPVTLRGHLADGWGALSDGAPAEADFQIVVGQPPVPSILE